MLDDPALVRADVGYCTFEAAAATVKLATDHAYSFLEAERSPAISVFSVRVKGAPNLF